MTYEQPTLPYQPDALEPVISRETIDYHYGKHEKAYIDNLNKLIKGTEYEDMDLEEIIRNSDGALYNNAAQAWNHIFYFFTFSPNGSREPTGDLRRAIDRDFGSFDKFKEAFEQAGASLFGSGWVWLSRDDDGKLFISQGNNAQNPLKDGLVPLLTFDVWEHAYYIDYRNARAAYLKKLWDIVDWDIVADRY
ncbi:MAG: superoxide dismutase [Muribaculaceae bacterium]